MRLTHDRRGQSVVVGTVILFGFLILALSLYQVQVVPQENAQVEFQHFEEVQNDLVSVRSSILTVGQSGEAQFPTVRLGTSYQPRAVAINPPAPAGTLQTSPSYDIVIDPDSGDPENVSTRFLQYRPGYNELQVGSIWYDNSALYLYDRSQENPVFIEEQALVKDGTLQITALQNEFRASGVRRITVELYSAQSANNIDFEGPANVSIPTRLDGEEVDNSYWERQVADENGVSFLSIDDTEHEGVYELNLRIDSQENLRVNTVGIQSEPVEGPSQSESGDGNTGDNGDTDNGDNGNTGDNGDNGDTGASDLEMRVDDLSDRQPNDPEFYVSYDVEGSFDEVEITAESMDSSASDTVTTTDPRGGVSLTPGFGDGQEFEITATVIDDGQTVSERTLVTDADTQNPAGNDDLSLAGSATLDTSEIRDRTQVNNNNVRYRFSWEVSATGSYSQTRMYVLNENGNGASGSDARTARSANNINVNVGDGANTQYKLAILVLDADGAVVDDRIENDTANNSGVI